MSATIGGKVKLDGESEYKKALKDISSEVKTLKSEMTAASSSFDENASAEEKAQKSAALLSDAMEAQQKKIDLVQERLDKANEVYGEGSTETLKYRQELANAQTELGKMRDQADKTADAQDDLSDSEAEVGENADDAGDKVSTFGEVLKANLAADAIKSGISAIVDGIKNIASSAADAWSEVDEGADTITTMTGASGDALEEMQDQMKEIATEIPTDFSTAGSAIGEVNTRFGLTGDSLKDLSTQFIEFANLNGTDVTSSINTVQTALDAFGLGADEAGAMLDSLTLAGQQSGISVDQLASSLTSNATAFQGLGLSAQDSINLLSKLEKSGVDTSVVITGLSKVQQNAAKDGKSMTDELSTALKSQADAIDVFGSKAGPKLYEAFHNGTLSVKDFTAAGASLNDALGTVANTYESTLDPMDKFTTAQNSLKEVGAQLVDAILPAFTPLLDAVTTALKNVDLTPLQDAIADTDFTPLTEGLTEIIEGVGNVIAFLAEHSPEIVAVINGVANTIGTIIQYVVNAVQAAAPVIQAIIEVLVGVIKGIAITCQDIWNVIGPLVTTAADTVKAVLGSDGVQGFIHNVMDDVQKVFDAFSADGILGVFDLIKDGIKEKIEFARDKVQEAIDKIKGFFNFEWHLPDLKLPHISVSGRFSLNPPSVPSFGIDWYAKAMQNGMILDDPTIFGAMNGKLLGAGESGPEVVVGASSLRDMISSAVSAGNNTNDIVINVYGAEGQDVRTLADLVADRINTAVSQKGRAFA